MTCQADLRISKGISWFSKKNNKIDKSLSNIIKNKTEANSCPPGVFILGKGDRPHTF